MPLRQFRIKSERYLDVESSDDEDEEDRDFFDEFVIVDDAEVKKAAEIIEKEIEKYNRPEDIEEEQKIKNADISELVFSRDSGIPQEVDQSAEPKSLEDFEILRVIDKGSFGKVFLVINKLNGKYYAMKRIRKGKFSIS
jgi:hypothetical protein